MYFYEILQCIMDEKKLSIPDVARLSNLTDSTVRSIFSRKNKTVVLEVAFKLSKGLGVSLEQLNGECSDSNLLFEKQRQKQAVLIQPKGYCLLSDDSKKVVDNLVIQLLQIQNKEKK